jgi:hypothetical protein
MSKAVKPTWNADGSCAKHNNTGMRCAKSELVPGRTVLMAAIDGKPWPRVFETPEQAEAFVEATHADAVEHTQLLLERHGKAVADANAWRQTYAVWQG